MALDKLTKIDGGGISTTSDYRVGVITATKFVGPVEGSITATDATFSGNVSIAGTLTYEDVTNVDSVGVITARNGIKVSTGTATTALVVDGDARVTGILTVGTSSLKLDGPNNLVNVGTALTLGHSQGVQFHTQNLHSAGFEVNQINASGIITATGADINGDLDVDGHTNLDNGNVSGVVTFSNSPSAIDMNDNSRISFGTSLKTSIFYNASESKTYIRNWNDTLHIGYRNTEIYHTNQARLTFDSGNTFSNVVNTNFSGANYNALWIPASNTFRFNDNAKLAFGNQTDATIHHNNANLLISNTTGNINVTGNVLLSNDLAVDGHTNLDNISIAGVTTIAHTGANQLTIKDSDTSGNGSSMRISFKDSGNTERFYIGNDESSNSYLYLGSPSGQNNNVALTVGGSTKLTAFSGGIGINGDLELQDTIYHAGDTNTKIRFPAADTFSVETGGTQGVRITSAQKLLVGDHTSSRSIGNSEHILQTEGTSADENGISIYALNNSAHAGHFTFGKSRANSTVTTNDFLGHILWCAHDGTDVNSTAARITAAIDGTPGSNDTPGRLMFYTTADGSQNVTERLRIDSSGSVRIENTDYAAQAAGNELIVGTTSGDNGITIASGSSGTGNIFFGDGDSNSIGYVRYDHNSNFLKFNVNGSERLRIDSSGRVLIGLASDPAESSIVAEGNSNSGTSYAVLDLRRGSAASAAGNVCGYVRFSDTNIDSSNRNYAWIAGMADGTSSSGADNPGRLVFATCPDNSTGLLERLRIDSAGRLIAGGASAGPYHQDGDEFNIYSTGNTGMSIFSGTSSLGSLFFADGNNDVHEQRRGAIQYNHNGNYLAFWTNAGERLRIESSGAMRLKSEYLRFQAGDHQVSDFSQKVGLKWTYETDIEIAKIEVSRPSWSGGPSDMLFHTCNTSGQVNERLRITSAGRVGINETSPDGELHIKGTNPFIYLEGTNGSGRQHKIWSAGTNSESLQLSSGNLLYNGDVHYFRASNESTEYARITSGGIISNSNIDLGGELNFTGNGHKYIDVATLNGGNALTIRHQDGGSYETAAYFDANGGAYLQFNGSTKFATTNTGVTVTGNISATGGQLTLENGNEEQIHRFWTNSSDSDIYGLLSGSTFGTIVEGANNGHHVIALRDNDTTDSFAIVSGGGNYQTDSTYDKLVARFYANGVFHMPDNNRIKLGTGNDLQIYSTGARAYIDHVTGGTGSDLWLRTKTFVVSNYSNDEKMIVANENGSVNLYYNDSNKFQTTNTGINLSGTIHTLVGDFYPSNDNNDRLGLSNRAWSQVNTHELYVREYSQHLDNKVAYFGNSNDARLFHDGTNTNLQNDTGILRIIGQTGQKIDFCDDTYTTFYARFNSGAGIDLRYNNGVKFETTSSGTKTTGEHEVTGILNLPTTDTGITFGPGTSVNDRAHIEWKGGDNAGYLRISVEDDSDSDIHANEHIEFGDYSLNERGGVFTQHCRISRDQFLVRTGLGAGASDRFKVDVGGVTHALNNLNVSGITTSGGNLHVHGDIHMDGTATTTNQNRRIYWTGFDKESVSDASDTAEIRHTTNVHGITGSVLEILSKNDAADGIALNAGNNGTGPIALVGKKIDVSGYIEPSAGSGDNGIKWAPDPFGGSGDIATMQYYRDSGSGENTRLRILVGNDGDDDLYLQGNGVHAQGNFSKSSGSFRIPHVLPGLTTTTDLVHSFVEGPQADNLYRGRTKLVAGISTVNIDATNNMTDGTFVNLNRDVQCFTSNETGWTAVKGSVTGNLLTIVAQDNTCTDTISWMVVGERWDLAMYDPLNSMTDENGKVRTEVPNRNYAKGYNEDYINENKFRVGISTISRPSIENKEVE